MSNDPNSGASPGDRQGSEGPARPGGESESVPVKQEPPKCLRCGRNEPVDEDGFCEPCLKEIDQACL